MKTLLRKLLPPLVLDIFHAIKSAGNVKKRELKKITATPRYQQGFTNILQLGSPVKFIDSASFEFIYDELFVKEIYKFKTQLPQPYIIDAGANIGLSIIYFKKIYPNAAIVAFEADKSVFKILDSNISALNYQNVELINKALWSEETVLKFYSDGADGGRIATSNDTENITEIATTKLSFYLENKQVDFLKVDIEGAEYRVLLEAKEGLKNVRNIFVEYHSFVGQEQFLPELFLILKEAGFIINMQQVNIFSPQPFVEKIRNNGMDLQINIFGTRK
ncbi:MAG TPA: FkbM family methyltransferase [Bacteroidia bacterium]|nr:FkbM family methyltransferase [Bacteroidia bacterium]HNU34774.1 FkbM family methyltransferase [Bacteroidia bacterium]